MADWQPIETAPRDDGFILLHVPNGQTEMTVTIGNYWAGDQDEPEGWIALDWDCNFTVVDPDKWQPMPPPPSSPTSPT